TGQSGLYYGPWWYWLLAFPFSLSGGHPTVVTAFVALFSVAVISCAFWWAVRQEGVWFAIFLTLILSVSSAIVSRTTQLWSPSLAMPFTLIAVLLLSKVQTRTKIKMILLGVVIGLLIEMEMV